MMALCMRHRGAQIDDRFCAEKAMWMHRECEIREEDGLTGMDPFRHVMEVELWKLVTFRMYLLEH